MLDSQSELGVDQAEAHVLNHLHESGPVSVGALNTALHHKKSTMTSILDRLGARGLIERTSDPQNRRTFLVSLTSSGQVLARAVHRFLKNIEDALHVQFTAEELEIARRVLEALTQ